MITLLSRGKPEWQRPDRRWTARRMECAACGWREEADRTEEPTFCPSCASVYVRAKEIYAYDEDKRCPCCGRVRCD